MNPELIAFLQAQFMTFWYLAEKGTFGPLGPSLFLSFARSIRAVLQEQIQAMKQPGRTNREACAHYVKSARCLFDRVEDLESCAREMADNRNFEVLPAALGTMAFLQANSEAMSRLAVDSL